MYFINFPFVSFVYNVSTHVDTVYIREIFYSYNILVFILSHCFPYKSQSLVIIVVLNCTSKQIIVKFSGITALYA